MLTKSFNSTKCKMSLKLASSRLKLLKNKKEVQVKQMKRELSQLLDSGQDRTARIRVEHVLREEKMMAAYDLIEIYCELIVARLPIIESQKNCPIDLKEAITSVVFASPRCGDIPELVDVRKHLTAKYGKEFISAAVELRPNCGVSRMLVEKLSAKAPDGQTKMRILGAIAEEHGVKWDPKSVEETESVPSNDLLNGSGSLEKAGNIHEDPLHLNASVMRLPLDHCKRPNASSNPQEQNARSSLETQSFDSAYSGGRGVTPSSNYHHGVSPSGSRDERSEIGQSVPGDGKFSMDRQNWNMEFKDATSAAQAAAESAERASLAARAAAELSRVSRQYSSESQRPEVQSLVGGGRGMYDTSIHEHFSKDSANSSLSDRNPRLQNGRIDSLHHENLARATRQFHDDDHATSGGSGPGNYGSSSMHEHFPKDSVVSSSPNRTSRFQQERTESLQHDNMPRATRHDNDMHGTFDRPDSQVSAGATGSINTDNSFPSVGEGYKYMQKSLSKADSEMITRKSVGRTESESTGSFKNELVEDFNYFGEEASRKDPKINSSESYLSASGFGENIHHSNQQSYGYAKTNDPFNNVYQGHIPSETVSKSSHDSASVAFDDSGSEEDYNIKFDSDPTYDDQQAKLYFPSPERKSPTYNSAIKESWSFDSNKSQEESSMTSEIFVEKQSPQLYKSLAAAGDNSRQENVVPSFDDSDGMNSESDSEIVQHPIGTDGNKWLPALPRTQTDHDTLASSVSDSEKAFTFGKLTGGLKHKGHIPPPYLRSQLNSVPSSVENAKGSPAVTSQDVAPPKSSVGLGMRMKIDDKSSSRLDDTHHASDTDSSDAEFSQEASSYSQRTYSQKRGSEVNTKYAGLRGSSTYFDSDSSDSEAGPKKHSFAGRSQLNSGISRRTKASSSSFDTNISSKSKISSETAVNSDSGVDGKPINCSFGIKTQEPLKPVRNSYAADTQKTQRLTKNFYSSESHESPTDKRISLEQPSAGPTVPMPVIQTRITSHERRQKMGRVEKPSSSSQMAAASGNNDVPKAPASSGDKFSSADSMKKASHVHPKLPDYDDIASKLLSLRTSPK